jgi:adenylosuccinate lyase
VVFPDATLLTHYGLHRAAGVIECLEVREPQIRARVAEAGQTVFSGHLLLALVRLGVSREEAYRWIQAAAHRSLDERIDFVSALAQTPEILARMRPEEVESLTSLDYQLRHVDSIYRKLELGGKSQGAAVGGGRSVAAARRESASRRLRRVRSE